MYKVFFAISISLFIASIPLLLQNEEKWNVTSYKNNKYVDALGKLYFEYIPVNTEIKQTRVNLGIGLLFLSGCTCLSGAYIYGRKSGHNNKPKEA